MNRATKTLILTLMVSAGVNTTSAKRIARLPFDPLVSNISQYSAKLNLPTTQLKPSSIRVSVPSYPVSRNLNGFRGYFHSCGFMPIHPNHFFPRVTILPRDPVTVLAEAYLKCRTINAALIEPAVSVVSYPPGYFGEYEYAGLLVSDWLAFSDEDILRQLFTLLVEVTTAPDEEWEDFFYFSDNPDAKLDEYRIATGFKPEFLFELVGDTTVRLEINLTNERLVIQQDEKWSGYKLDKGSAAALRQILLTEQKKTREHTASNPAPPL